MKELKITVPQGYEIDREKSTFENIIFKKLEDEKPKWEDFGEVRGYYIDGGNSEIVNELTSEVYSSDTNMFSKDVWPSKEEAEAALALSQLCQWRDKYNEGWKPDWNIATQKKYCVNIFENRIRKINVELYNLILSFKTSEIRDKFLEDFKDLIEIAKPLL